MLSRAAEIDLNAGSPFHILLGTVYAASSATHWLIHAERYHSEKFLRYYDTNRLDPPIHIPSSSVVFEKGF